MQPIARSADLTVKRMGDEVVVFDARDGSVHHLNRVADIVWRACDGQTDLAGLARIVERVGQVADPVPAVELALEQLSRRGLLETAVERAAPDRRRDRRDALKLLAKAAAIPVVLTLTANRARAANGTGQPCTKSCSRPFIPSSSPGKPPLLTSDTTFVMGFYGIGGIECIAICPPGYT